MGEPTPTPEPMPTPAPTPEPAPNPEPTPEKAFTQADIDNAVAEAKAQWRGLELKDSGVEVSNNVKTTYFGVAWRVLKKDGSYRFTLILIVILLAMIVIKK